MTPEGRVKADVKKYLAARGFWAAASKPPTAPVVGWYYMPVSNGMGVHGIPDFCCTYKGLAFYIETKAKGDCTPNQLKRHEEIRAAGGHVVVARSVADVEDALLELDILLTNRSTT